MSDEDKYIEGWNAAIDAMVERLMRLSKSFGADTLHSFAVWMQELKK